MLGIHHYWLFLLSGLLLALTPGQDTMYILGRSLSGGLRSGVASTLGITVGTIIHTLAAAAGLSVLLATSPLAFTVVKICGAAYLVFLGARLLLFAARAAPDPQGASACGGAWSAFGQGIVSNVLNPKVALFFLALLPQFIDPSSSSKTLAFLALGAHFHRDRHALVPGAGDHRRAAAEIFRAQSRGAHTDQPRRGKSLCPAWRAAGLEPLKRSRPQFVSP